MRPDEVLQRQHYAQIAPRYDSLHVDAEHIVALSFLRGMLDYVGAKSVLDVGAGTGRAMAYLREARPDLRIVGIEPVTELRAAGHRKGIPESELIAGNGYNLPFHDAEFDIVCEVGVLHHVREPHRVIEEMLRVSRAAIFISDSNNFGGGAPTTRFVKQLLNTLRLWRMVQFVATGGRGYWVTDGDGLFYSYSVFNNLEQIKRRCRQTYLINTCPSGYNLYRTAEHVALLAVK